MRKRLAEEWATLDLLTLIPKLEQNHLQEDLLLRESLLLPNLLPNLLSPTCWAVVTCSLRTSTKSSAVAAVVVA